MAKQNKATSKQRLLAVQLLIAAVEGTPELTTAQVLCTIMRRRGKAVDPYDWTDEQLISEIRNYQCSLIDDPFPPIEKDF